MRKFYPLIFLVFFLFWVSSAFIAGSAQAAQSGQATLDEILTKSAEYCRRLANSVLHFICVEDTLEQIYHPYSTRDSVSFRGFRTERNKYIYDLQFIRKGEDIQEQRKLLEENEKKGKNGEAPSRSRRFQCQYIILGPIGLLSEYWQQFHDYKIVGEETLEKSDCYVIEATPKSFFEVQHLFGKAWMRKDDFSIMKIEWDQRGLGNFEAIAETAERLRAKPQITLTPEYAYEKNGIRFPSRMTINEVYIADSGRKLIKSTTTVVYKDYKFFTVETDIKYK